MNDRGFTDGWVGWRWSKNKQKLSPRQYCRGQSCSLPYPTAIAVHPTTGSAHCTLSPSGPRGGSALHLLLLLLLSGISVVRTSSLQEGSAGSPEQLPPSSTFFVACYPRSTVAPCTSTQPQRSQPAQHHKTGRIILCI